MTDTLKLRFRFPGSPAPKEIAMEADAPWIGVLYALESESGISIDKLKILSGFPPKPFAPEDENTPLKDLKIRNGDLFIVQEGEATVRIVNTGGRYARPVSDRAHFTRRICPSDNSCLFHACAYVLCNKSRSDGPRLRQQCVEAVLSDRATFNVNTLGQTPESYAAWLSSASNWGGGVELQILSKLYKTEIVALDLESTRMQAFGEDENYDVRAFVVYTGNHYDCIAMNETYGESGLESKDQVLFNPRDNTVLERARRFVKDEGEKLKAVRGKRG